MADQVQKLQTEQQAGSGAQQGLIRRNWKFFAVGIYFGVVLVKTEVISWYRIQEMFHFQSIYMYGILGSAVLVGALSIMLIRLFRLRSFGGEELNLRGKPFNKIGNPAGGTIFGMGWALTGACPGPLYALLGAGYISVVVALVGALLGVVAYGYARPKLPH
jgi:hypothetical protein